jgi:hypothetical protein
MISLHSIRTQGTHHDEKIEELSIGQAVCRLLMVASSASVLATLEEDALETRVGYQTVDRQYYSGPAKEMAVLAQAIYWAVELRGLIAGPLENGQIQSRAIRAGAINLEVPLDRHDINRLDQERRRQLAALLTLSMGAQVADLLRLWMEWAWRMEKRMAIMWRAIARAHDNQWPLEMAFEDILTEPSAIPV